MSYVTVSAKTVLNGTFVITRKTDFQAGVALLCWTLAMPDLQYN